MKKNVTIDYLEYSSAMLKMAKARNVKTNSVNFILGDENSIKYENHYDVVITHYFLDLFHEEKLGNVIRKLFKSLNSNGYWLVADFYLDEKSSFKQKGTVWLMYKFFKFFCNIETQHLILPDSIFESYFLSKMKQKFFYRNLIRSTVWENKD
jgi:tRNA (cmo5U34)-methyltransferase